MSELGLGLHGSLHRGFVGGRTGRFLAAEVAKLAELARQQHPGSQTRHPGTAEARTDQGRRAAGQRDSMSGDVLDSPSLLNGLRPAEVALHARKEALHARQGTLKALLGQLFFWVVLPLHQ